MKYKMATTFKPEQLNKLIVKREKPSNEVYYVCQNVACNSETREIAMPGRNVSICARCGAVSIKKNLVRTLPYNWVKEPLPSKDELDSDFDFEEED